MGYDEYKFSVLRVRGFLFFAKAGTRIKERMLVCRPRVIYCEFPLHSDLENAWRLKRGNQLYLTSSFCDDPKYRLRSGAKGPYSRMDAEDLGGALEGSLWTVPKGTFFLHVALIEVQNISSIELSGPYTINGTDVVVDARPAAVQRPEETKLLEQLLDPAGPVRGLLAVDAAPDLWRLPMCVSDLVITCSRHAESTFRGLRLVIEAWEKDWNDPWNKPWTPARHRFFPEKDKKMMETLLRCQSRDDCPVSLLPADALFAIFNLCGKKEGAEEEDEEDEEEEEQEEDDEEDEDEEEEEEEDEDEEDDEEEEEEPAAKKAKH